MMMSALLGSLALWKPWKT